MDIEGNLSHNRISRNADFVSNSPSHRHDVSPSQAHSEPRRYRFSSSSGVDLRQIPTGDQPLDLSTMPLLEMALILDSSGFACARHCHDPLSGLPASCKDYLDPPP